MLNMCELYCAESNIQGRLHPHLPLMSSCEDREETANVIMCFVVQMLRERRSRKTNLIVAHCQLLHDHQYVLEACSAQ